MSRSYRKPWIIVRGYRGVKQCANRAVRNTEDIPSGCAYKRCFPQWDIIDYRWLAPEGRWGWTREKGVYTYRPWKTNRK